MAGVNPFLAASIAMLLALIIPGWVAMRATITERLVAVQLGSVITALDSGLSQPGVRADLVP